MVWVPTGGPVGLHHDGPHADPGVVAARTCALLLLLLVLARLPGSWAGPFPVPSIGGPDLESRPPDRSTWQPKDPRQMTTITPAGRWAESAQRRGGSHGWRSNR
jgi:hypothetical protein